jgi:hypothetical protein
MAGASAYIAISIGATAAGAMTDFPPMAETDHSILNFLPEAPTVRRLVPGVWRPFRRRSLSGLAPDFSLFGENILRRLFFRRNGVLRHFE